MSELIDRAATALLRARWARTLPAHPVRAIDDDDRADVRAVLAALREPSEAMRAAGLEHMACGCWGEDVPAAWRAMIDAALA